MKTLGQTLIGREAYFENGRKYKITNVIPNHHGDLIEVNNRGEIKLYRLHEHLNDIIVEESAPVKDFTQLDKTTRVIQKRSREYHIMDN